MCEIFKSLLLLFFTESRYRIYPFKNVDSSSVFCCFPFLLLLWPRSCSLLAAPVASVFGISHKADPTQWGMQWAMVGHHRSNLIRQCLRMSVNKTTTKIWRSLWGQLQQRPVLTLQQAFSERRMEKALVWGTEKHTCKKRVTWILCLCSIRASCWHCRGKPLLQSSLPLVQGTSIWAIPVFFREPESTEYHGEGLPV